MVDDVGGSRIATSAAEPLATSQTLDHAAWGMNAAVSKEVSLAQFS